MQKSKLLNAVRVVQIKQLEPNDVVILTIPARKRGDAAYVKECHEGMRQLFPQQKRVLMDDEQKIEIIRPAEEINLG